MFQKNKSSAVSLSGLVQVVAVFTVIFSLLTLFDEVHRYFELMVHFKLQYLVVSALCGVIFVLLRQFKSAGMMLLLLCFNAAFITPWYWTVDEADFKGVRFKIIHSNVNTANTAADKVIKLVNDENPDIFVAQEVSSRWLQDLTPIETRYPYKVVKPSNDNFGIALYSKHPLNKAQIVYLGSAHVPSIKVEMTLNETQAEPLTIITTHPLPPISEIYYRLRNEQLTALAELVKQIDHPLVVIGDLNVTMWSNNYTALIDGTRLRNARAGFGLLPSWPTMLPFAMIPIDHCLVSERVKVLNIHTGPDVGSDHLPLVVELGY